MTDAARRQDRILASPQFRDGRFHNTSGATARLEGDSLAVTRKFLFGKRHREPRIAIPVGDPSRAWAAPVSSGLRVTWLGHSTILLEIDGVRVLIDPVFGPRASPVPFAGPRRFHRAPVAVEHLPPVDLVLLSHDHHDHLNPPTIRALAGRQVPFVTALGVGARLERMGVLPELVTELDWWEEHRLPGGSLAITSTPAQHFSGRGLHDRNSTLWSSFVLTTSQRRVFFSGDTGLTQELGDIGSRFGPFELSLIEIGAWDRAWASIHLGPASALRAFELLGGGTLLPIHWGTFDLGLHAWDEPIETLLALAPAGTRIITPMLGEPVEPDRLEGPRPWWRSGG